MNVFSSLYGKNIPQEDTTDNKAGYPYVKFNSKIGTHDFLLTFTNLDPIHSRAFQTTYATKG